MVTESEKWGGLGLKDGYVGQYKMVTDRVDPNTYWNGTDRLRIWQAIQIIKSETASLGEEVYKKAFSSTYALPGAEITSPSGYIWYEEQAAKYQFVIDGVKELINASLDGCPSFNYLTCQSANQIEQLLFDMYRDIYFNAQPWCGVVFCG